ncbi:MAG: M20 family metallopeptidase [Lachnospiraceae bacterium]|nr:M20 family metallopeptidase [Lachnospiraceae bacterium]
MTESIKMAVAFTGKNAHAAAAPDLGRSAFDGLLLTISGIESLRKHLAAGLVIEYRITSSGNLPCNIVPDQARGEIEIQAADKTKLEWARKRLEDIVSGAAMMAGVKGSVLRDGQHVVVL